MAKEDPTNPSTDRLPAIESLNAQDLDVEELERRLELVTLTAEDGCWSFSCDKYMPPPV